MFLWFFDLAFGSSYESGPDGPRHPMVLSTVVVVATVGGQRVYPPSPDHPGFHSIGVALAVTELIKGDPTLEEVTVHLGVNRFVGPEGATVFVHLTPSALYPGAYVLAGDLGFPAIQRVESPTCGAVARMGLGPVLATYPPTTRELPAAYVPPPSADPASEMLRTEPTPEELCHGMRWEALLVNARAAARSGSAGE